MKLGTKADFDKFKNFEETISAEEATYNAAQTTTATFSNRFGVFNFQAVFQINDCTVYRFIWKQNFNPLDDQIEENKANCLPTDTPTCLLGKRAHEIESFEKIECKLG